MDIILQVLKTIFNIIAYSALFILVWAFVYVRQGGEIDLRYYNDDEEEEEEEESNLVEELNNTEINEEEKNS